MEAVQTQEKKKISKSEYLKSWIPYRIQRYWFFVGATVVALALPWIKIDGNHIFLLSFDHKKLHLAGTVFDMQELYLMPFLLMLLFIGIFAATVVGGRAWCGWACPQTIFRVIYRDLIETKILGLRKRISNKQKEPDFSTTENKIKKVLGILLWSLVALVAAADFIWFFVPPEEFFGYLMDPDEHMTFLGFFLGIAFFLIIDVVFLKEDFCVYICPYSRVQSVLYDDDTIMAIYDVKRGGEIYHGHGNEKAKQFSKQKELLSVEPNAECTTCESCVTVCPTHIDIRKGLQLECINCLECVDACTQVMGSLGKESLVRWSSEKEALRYEGKTNYFRTKVIAYFVVLVMILVALFVMGSEKEHMLINVNKGMRLYKVIDNGVVQNDYLFLIQNTEADTHTFTFEVVNNDKIRIVRPQDPKITIEAGKKSKMVVILETSEQLAKSNTDVSIPVKIKAYAIDDKSKKIVIYRDLVFTYPKFDQLKK